MSIPREYSGDREHEGIGLGNRVGLSGDLGDQQDARRPLVQRTLVVALVALAIVTVAAAAALYRAQRATIISQTYDELASIAELKIHSLNDWRDARIADANVIMGNRAFAGLVRQAVDHPERGVSADLLDWMGRIQGTGTYELVALTTPKGRVLASVPATSQPLSTSENSIVTSALADGAVKFEDFHRDESDASIHIGVVVPVVDLTGSGRKLGALYFRVDPAKHLYPFIKTWPVPSKTAETQLLRREGDYAVFLNPLRFSPNAALNTRVALKTSPQTPAAKAASGFSGNYEGPDYRGVDVFSVEQRVPGSNWFLVSKMDSAEALAPLNGRIWQVLLLLLAVSAVVAMGIWMVQRRRDLRLLRQQLEAESERAWLFDVLAISPSELRVLDAESLRITFANESALSGTGYTLDELRELTPADLDLGYDEGRLRGLAVEREAGARPTLSTETVFRRKDGSEYPATVEFRRMHTGTREVFLAVVDDVTERNAASDALRASEALLIESQRAAAVGHYVYDLRAGTWSSSEVVDELLGIDESFERTAQSWLDVVCPEDRKIMARYLQQRVLRDHQPLDADFRIQRVNDGVVRWVHGLGQLEFDEEGVPVTMFGVIQDITSRKLAELEVQRVHHELEQIVADRTAQLEAANRELEAFSYSVSHDLRAPLRHVSGFVELLGKKERDRLDEKGLHYLDVISDSVAQMGILIDDLLQFSRVGRVEMEPADVDMGELVEQARGQFEAELRDREVEWDVGEVPHVRGDRNMLRLVWTNLIGNALKYTRPRESAKILIGFREEMNETVFFVTDNGVGFDMTYSEKLFGVFQRLHSASEFEGTGIGLANVSRVITRHGGRVWAEAELDHGATFYFSIPHKKGKK